MKKITTYYKKVKIVGTNISRYKSVGNRYCKKGDLVVAKRLRQQHFLHIFCHLCKCHIKIYQRNGNVDIILKFQDLPDDKTQ